MKDVTRVWNHITSNRRGLDFKGIFPIYLFECYHILSVDVNHDETGEKTGSV